MRIALVHQPDAGLGEHPREEILALLHQRGHEVHYLPLDEKRLDEAVEGQDLVLIAGGDGTVSTVVWRLRGRGIPFAILPFGTANNIAAELGWLGEPAELIRALPEAQPTPFSIGLARGPWGARPFLEGVGLGPFASTIAFARTRRHGLMPQPQHREAKLRRDLQLVRAFLLDARPEHVTLRLDGEPLDGPFLLVEIMNTGRIGPNIELAPAADVRDDVLDVVTVGPEERFPLLDYLAQRQEGPCRPPSLPTRRARRIHMVVSGARMHIDDAVWPPEDQPPPPVGEPFEVEVSLAEKPVRALSRMPEKRLSGLG